MVTIDGLVVVDKPSGMTSHDVVALLRKIYGQRKVGHAGTLDPDATGVLLVGLGAATRLLRYLQDTAKGYAGTVVFGATTETLDAAGKVTGTFDMHTLGRDDVERAAQAFVGAIEQVPPMVSAIRVGGKRLHELARAGREVERPTRQVRIDTLAVTGFRTGSQPEADIEVECSSGTYIRALAADLGAALRGGAHLGTLRRTRVGSFTLAEAHSISDIERRSLDLVLTPLEAVRSLERAEVGDATARKVGHGNTFAAHDLLSPNAGAGPFAVTSGAQLLAVYERRGTGVKPSVVLATSGQADR